MRQRVKEGGRDGGRKGEKQNLYQYNESDFFCLFGSQSSVHIKDCANEELRKLAGT